MDRLVTSLLSGSLPNRLGSTPRPRSGRSLTSAQQGRTPARASPFESRSQRTKRNGVWPIKHGKDTRGISCKLMDETRAGGAVALGEQASTPEAQLVGSK